MTSGSSVPSASEQQSASASRLMRFTGHAYLRQRIVLSVLSGRPIRIDKIRASSSFTEPGLSNYEASFLRLIEKITNGSKVEIGYTGTSIFLKPGIVSGGKVTHDCGADKSISWYLEWIICLAPFAKRELHLTLKGITTHYNELGADILRTVTLPHLQLFMPTELSSLSSPLELRILKRGAPPLGGGEVFFCCPLLPSTGGTGSGGSSAGGMIRSLNFTQPGRVRRIRGIASATRVSPQMANRMIDSARGVLNRYIPDLYLFADVFKGDESGKSPGYALSLVATSTTGVLHCAEALSNPSSSEQSLSTPEEVALSASRALLTEIASRGCIDRAHQAMVLLLMAVGPEDVSKVRMGRLTANAVQMLRDIQDTLGVRFKIKDADAEQGKKRAKSVVHAENAEPSETKVEVEGDEVILSCFGVAVRGARKVG
ncbi:18S rRNA biogenesis protein [Tilletiaria anomala UBC 951]|uniref:18S rRNA biogenesis protein n=1 Tax=Tilletiaria anomala (strain ATCC 24038 / CBS 436.72 / UBC 951) TaxID=1037660 RepID=A0A066W4N1_TILAU|nr:18S rRNA biogenesis protein [Tilletiaria anomala UBC 951]KDN45735.1 18S rRNA biogenesis protein [Tilletiaria anomala UBC 951]